MSVPRSVTITRSPRGLGEQLLRYLPAAVCARKGRHLEIGEITLGHLLNGWCFHDLGHIRQISELYRTRAFFTNMGNFQRYYNPKP